METYKKDGIFFTKIEPPTALVGFKAGREENYSDKIFIDSGNFFLNCFDIDWNNVKLFEDDVTVISTSSDLLNIISTLMEFIDIVLSVDPTNKASVYMGKLSEIQTLLVSEETDLGTPVYHISEELAEDPKTAIQSLVNSGVIKQVDANDFSVAEYLGGSLNNASHSYKKGEELCYFGPAKFIRKDSNKKTNKTCFQINNAFLSVLYCTKKKHNGSFGHTENHSTEDETFKIDGEDYVIAISQTPSDSGTYKLIELQ